MRRCFHLGHMRDRWCVETVFVVIVIFVTHLGVRFLMRRARQGHTRDIEERLTSSRRKIDRRGVKNRRMMFGLVNGPRDGNSRWSFQIGRDSREETLRWRLCLFLKNEQTSNECFSLSIECLTSCFCALVSFTFWSIACCWEINFCRFSLENRLCHRSLIELLFNCNEIVSHWSLFSFGFCTSCWSIISSHDLDFFIRFNRGNGRIRAKDARFCLVFTRTWSLGWRKR